MNKDQAHRASLPRLHAPSRAERGMTTLLVVGFMAVFTLIVGSLASYVFQQSRYGRALFAREQALNIAEAGLEYYKWLIARIPTAVTTGDGLPVNPVSYTVSDPEGGTLGSAEITATPVLQCGRVQWIDVSSKGTAVSDVGLPRTVQARYMKPSVAEYAFVTDSPVYFTSVVTGPVHGNSGVRMDGTNNSIVSSYLGESAYYCDNSSMSLGCDGSGGDPPAGYKDGVFGSGPNSVLWRFPLSKIDFNVMNVDTAPLKNYANADGLYLSPTRVYLDGVAQGSSFTSVGGREDRGFHVVFNSNGTVTVKRVTGTNSLSSTYMPPTFSGDWVSITDYPDIASETTIGTYTLPSDCALVYSQAKTWISGTVAGKKTIVADDPDSSTFSPDIMLGGTIVVGDGNISYATIDGTTGLTAIAEGSVRIANKVPDDMSIRGVFVARKGFYGRYYYAYTSPSTSYNYRNSITLNGAVITKLRASNWYGNSGFSNRYTYYDRLQAFDPPPFTPSARVDYGYVLWREE